MSEINKIKKIAGELSVLFVILSIFIVCLFVGYTILSLSSSPLPFFPETDESPLKINFLKNISGIIGFITLELSFVVMIKAFRAISKDGRPFSQKNIKTFRLSGIIMSCGGLFGSFVYTVSTQILPVYETVNLEGLNLGLSIYGIISAVFIEFLRYASTVQDELDTIA